MKRKKKNLSVMRCFAPDNSNNRIIVTIAITVQYIVYACELAIKL